MKTKKTLLIFLGVLMTGSIVQAQGLVDGYYNQKGHLAVTTSYTRVGAYDEFYVGKEKTGPVPVHNEISQDIFGVYAKYGLLDDLTLVLNVPYIATKGYGNPDPVNGETKQSDFQDVCLTAKYRPFRADFSSGRIDGITALGFAIPSGYEPNGILSIGNGAFSTDLHIGGHLQLNGGFFSTLIAGYSFRGKASDNLGTNGGADFDVPNAFLAVGKLGYAASKFYVELWMDYQASSSDGVDIMGPGFANNFPETRVDYTRLGISGSVPITKGIGLSAGYGTLLDGRNIGNSGYFSTGVTFSFDTASSSVN